MAGLGWLVCLVFYLVLAYYSLLRLVMGCSTFYKKVKAHKASQKLETLKRVKENTVRKKMRASKVSEEMNARKERQKRHARHVEKECT